jgi:thiol-disulfide isomerase/thioredoxin
MSPTPPSSAASDWLVACLCARWCTTCEAYRATFAEVAGQHPGWRFVWIDVEDDADALGDGALDIENFPTVLLLEAGAPRFFGTVLPHAATLARTLDAARAGALASAGVGAEAAGLAPAVQALAARRALP